jgi:uncharacterized OB-fold protein
VHTFTVCNKKADGTDSDEPILMAVVRIDDTDGSLVHRLGQVRAEDVYIGMPVEAVFKPTKERKGSILDIEYFKPIQ